MKNRIAAAALLLLAVFAFESCVKDEIPDVRTQCVDIRYSAAGVSVSNPFESQGVRVTVRGSDVVVRSNFSNSGLRFRLSGVTANGSFQLFGLHSYGLEFNGLDLTNPDGPAINIQSKKATYVSVLPGTVNVLRDGLLYDPVVGADSLKQSAAFFSRGQLVFSGTGTLTIQASGLQQHALSSDDYIQVDSVTLNVASSAKDGINCNDGYIQKGGTVSVQCNGDGIDAGTAFVAISGGHLGVRCDSLGADAITCDSLVTVTGGTLSLLLFGDQSKGIKGGQGVHLMGGSIAVEAAGGPVFSPYLNGMDPSYCSAIKSDGDVVLNGASVIIVHSGIAGRGISAGRDFIMNSGSLDVATSGNGALYLNELGLTDACAAAGVSTGRFATLLGGTFKGRSTGAGGKCLSADSTVTIGDALGGPEVVLESTGAAIKNGSTSLTEAKVLKSDFNVYVQNGKIALNAAGSGEALDAAGGVYLNGGTLVAQGPGAGTGVRAIDFKTVFQVNGGTLVACGPYRSSMPLPSMITSKQDYLYAHSNNINYSLAADTLFNIQDSLSHSVLTFRTKRNLFFVLFSSPLLKRGDTYTVRIGGGFLPDEAFFDWNGWLTGGSYVGGTRKLSFTPSAIKTEVSFVPTTLIQ
jgi:hypothetical protein